MAQIRQEDPVDAAVPGQPLVPLRLCGLVPDHLQHERVAPLAEDRLDPGDEAEEERVDAQQLGRAGDDKAEGEGA